MDSPPLGDSHSNLPSGLSEKAERSTSDLIDSLGRLSRKDPKLVKSTPHVVESRQGPRVIRSWKMNEYKYSVQPSPFPTLARGLFTEWLPAKGKANGKDRDHSKPEVDQDGTHRIVARGYDKFFNIGEVRWTTWLALKRNTSEPYILTLKSNGCIIFMAALSPTELIVMSKHSLGAVEGAEVSHAQMGEIWLDRHLKAKGKSREEMAARLWRDNLTAVAELCDDSFEEHVLPYSAELTGLHLHGLNRNEGAFQTMDTVQVDAFAEEWGFIKTDSISLPTTDAVKEFTDEIGKTGNWNGLAVEGFVVRTKVADYDASTALAGATDSPPYAPGQDFFFKIKFDEPYMTYRDWREMTRTIIAKRGKKGGGEAVIARSKLRRPESHLYRRWVERELDMYPGVFAKFNMGQGIIAVRERFLAWLETPEGKSELEKEKAGKGKRLFVQVEKQAEAEWQRVVIIPVAVPGSGKTAIGVALSHIFGIGHTQSDDVTTKRTGPTFVKNITDLFKKHMIVYADRNNHLQDHRKGIREAVKRIKTGPPIRTLALYWPHDLPFATIQRICSDRVLARGSNHQSLRGDADSRHHEEVIYSFISSAQELGETEVDDILEMNLEDTLEQAVTRVVNHLVPLVKGLEDPGAEKIQEACDIARSYRPSVSKEVVGQVKATNARYFGLLPEINIREVVLTALEHTEETEGVVDEIIQQLEIFWRRLEPKRVVPRPHVTIVHSKSLPGSYPLWNDCLTLQKVKPPPTFKFRLGEILSDGKVMCATAVDLEVSEENAESAEEGKTFLDHLPDDVRNRLHITIGTESDNTPAWNAGILVEQWKAGTTEGDVQVLPLRGVYAQGRVKGLF